MATHSRLSHSRKRVFTSIALVTAILLSSCTMGLVSQTVDIYPAQLSWYYRTIHNAFKPLYPGVGLCMTGSASPLYDDRSPGETMIGYTDIYYEDWPCWDRLTRYARTYVRFDLSSVANASSVMVTKAVLRFNEKVVERRGIDLAPSAGGAGSCLSPTMFEAAAMPGGAEDVLGASIDSALIATTSGWDITGLASGWVTGSADNFGLVLAGADERDVDLTRSCLSVLSEFRITVTYTSFGIIPPSPTFPLGRVVLTPVYMKSPTSTKTPTPTRTRTPTRTPTRTRTPVK